ESPAKAKTIKKFLGRGYKVEASMGHVRDLPKSQMGVDKERGFEPKYITIRGKGPVLDKIKKEAKEADKILLATDPDREGEAISWHLAHILDLDTSSPCRIEFNEVTKDAVKRALKNPRPIDGRLVEAQQARRIVDRLVGYEISPLLWKKVKKGLSAGRVQSVALRLICDREEQIERFVPEEYWRLFATLYKKNRRESFKAELHSRSGKKISIGSREEMDSVLKDIKDEKFEVTEIKKGKKARSPYPPYITSSLQQDAHNKLGFTVKRTMAAAQQLYEGVDIKGVGTEGLITYMRTDSVRISDTALVQVRDYVKKEWGEGYLPEKPRYYKSKKGAQGAHEAIRPTSVNRTPDSIRDSLTPDQYKVYSLIWKRFVASQMVDALYDTVNVNVACGQYLFKAAGMALTFKGFLQVMDDDAENKQEEIPPLEKGDLLKIKKLDDKQYFTQPPARYTEASLIKALEDDGIGRPSTYAPVISTILQRGYVEKDKKSLVPTYLGKVVNEVMEEYFTDIVDVDFTADMEEKLDEIEENGIEWRKVVEDFYRPLEEMVTRAEKKMEKIVIREKETEEICDRCGRNMVIKHGKYGKFLACPGFPECRNTKPLLEKAGVPCPKCGGDIVIKRTKKGRTFYGCANYPDCDFMTWNKPSAEKCKECGQNLWEAKGRKGNGPVCLNVECKNYSG
ncbi:MAG: type I DNA topoisomerase, partial [Clostridiales bacterium]|nr:type I DNA topoisomerase [Clostridiales bacterium]